MVNVRWTGELDLDPDRKEGYLDVELPRGWKVAAITFHDANGVGIVRLGLLHDD